MIKTPTRNMMIAQRGLRLMHWLIAAPTCTSMALAAESSGNIATPSLMQWTSSIDVRTAFIVSAISVVILFGVGKIDFKSPLGIWGGRFIIFALVMLNLALWSTQV